jgi:prepilin-type N-terminal cleavage/methylation domain-containing protein/prepilin-type processing-associated H-X9-DG protein
MNAGHKIKRRAFTILELMVVVSIIAVLAALLVPAVGSAKENANKAKCMSNIRQVGIAIEFYKEDNDQYFPIRYPPNPYSYWDKYAYMNILGSNYFRATWGVFKCPSNRNTVDMNFRTNSLGGQMDYEMNSGIFAMQVSGTNGFDHGALGNEKITVPTLAVVIYDWPGPNYFGYAPAPTSPHPSGGINAYFADGHTAWITAEESDDWKQGQQPFYKWGRDP